MVAVATQRIMTQVDDAPASEASVGKDGATPALLKEEVASDGGVDDKQPFDAGQKWDELSMKVLCKTHRSPVHALGDASFNCLRAILLEILVQVAEMEGSWPLIFSSIVFANRLAELANISLAMWSQCRPDQFREDWDNEAQKEWIFNTQVFLYQISEQEISTFEALQFLAALLALFAQGINPMDASTDLGETLAWIKLGMEYCEPIRHAKETQQLDLDTAFVVDPVLRTLFQSGTSDFEKQGICGQDQDVLEAQRKQLALVSVPVIGGQASGVLLALHNMVPKNSSGDSARLAAIAGGWTMSVGSYVGLAAVTATGSVTLLPVMAAIWNWGPAAGTFAGGAVGVAMSKMKIGAAAESQATQRSDELFEVWRVRSPTARELALTTSANKVIRLQAWNNFSCGSDLDIIEAFVAPDSSLGADEVMFEFHVLEHITWRKRLVVCLGGEGADTGAVDGEGAGDGSGAGAGAALNVVSNAHTKQESLQSASDDPGPNIDSGQQASDLEAKNGDKVVSAHCEQSSSFSLFRWWNSNEDLAVDSKDTAFKSVEPVGATSETGGGQSGYSTEQFRKWWYSEKGSDDCENENVQKGDISKQSEIREELDCTSECRVSTSKVYKVSRDWPLALEIWKYGYTGVLRQVGSPRHVALICGGCKVVVVYLKDR